MKKVGNDLDYKALREFFETHDNYVILTHRSPDGDTLGSGFALWGVLTDMGKHAKVLNSEPFPMHYDFLYDGYCPGEFDEQTIVAVDIADEKLLGDELMHYAGKVDVCIDHHISNKMYAKHTVLDGDASAAALILYDFLKSENIKISRQQARCLYTGIATDTGCFKFENTTPSAHIAAAELMGLGIDYSRINRLMFDIKSRERLAVESAAADKMEYWLDGKCAVICLTRALIESTGVEAAEFDGLASLPISIKGAVIGLTIKERGDDLYRVSVRTAEEMDASKFCKRFGGGGHIRAAGCELRGSLDEVKSALYSAVAQALNAEKNYAD